MYFDGAPADVEIDEIKDFFSMCGVIQTDPETKGPRIKLYRDQDGNLKVLIFYNICGGVIFSQGDGSVCFLRHLSVDQAVTLRHESLLRGK